MDLERDLVEEPLVEQLVRVCRPAIGDSLRSITYFTSDQFEQVYLRSDLDADADLAGFVDHETNGFRARTAYRGSELGEYDYTVRAFENGFLTRVTAAGHGVFVTTDGLTLNSARDVAAALSEVLTEAEDE
ncbi:MAG: DUF7522 family protein [Halobacteriota archaeon]